jgi:hypothetical protein
MYPQSRLCDQRGKAPKSAKIRKTTKIVPSIAPSFSSKLIQQLSIALAEAYSRKRMKESKHIQQPQHHDNHHHGVQDGLNAACHGDEAVHQP